MILSRKSNLKRQRGGVGSLIESATLTTPLVSSTSSSTTTSSTTTGTTSRVTTSSTSSTTTQTTATTPSPTSLSSTTTTPLPTTETTPIAPVTSATIITPSTVIVIGTRTVTSALPPVTSSDITTPTATSSQNNANSSGLSNGARTGIIVGSVIGALALLALVVVLCLSCRRKRRNNLDKADNIRWPEVAASAEDRAALYPESTRPTGRSGLGNEMEENEGPAVLAAGAAGVGAYTASRNYSQSSRQPTLPQIPSSVYDEEYSQNSHYGSSPYSANDSVSYGQLPVNSHQAPGPASIEYVQNVSPPRNAFPPRSGSSNGHLNHEFNGGSEEAHSDEVLVSNPAEIERSGSPTEFSGYHEQTRLSIVNPDNR